MGFNRPRVIMETIEKDGRFTLAERYVQETGVSVFLTGKAGTGKTTFLRHIVEETTKRCAVVAPTGVAAVNAGGVTIHSFFQLPLCPYLPDVKELVTEYQMPEKYRSLRKERVRILRTLDLLVIDEISMARADLLDAIDATLRRYRRNDKPFGGVQLLMIGDIQQLPPVVTDAEKPYMDQVYPSPFFFNSKALRLLPYIVVELDKIYRQSDARFTDILNDVRTGRPSRETLRVLNQRLDPAFEPPSDEHWIRLTTHNYQADSVNKAKLDELGGESMASEAEIEGNYPESAYPADTLLTLKVGAQVMFTRNDTFGLGRYYNGKIGTVTSLAPTLVVTDENGDEIVVDKEKWENVRYEIDPVDNEIKPVTDGTFIQYPLRLAWAVTIHKSQGLTFDRVVIDAGRAFSFGQVYVALSRCRTLEGIVLSTPIGERCTFTSEEVTSFEGTYTPPETAESELPRFRTEFYADKLCEAFNLRRLRYTYGRLAGVWEDRLGKLYPALAKTVASLAKGEDESKPGFEELVLIAGRFQVQARKIIASEGTSSAYLKERVGKAAKYFIERLAALAKVSAPMAVVEIENKETKKVFKTATEEYLKELRFRLSLYKEILADGFSPKRFSAVSTECELAPSSSLKALANSIAGVYGMPKAKEGGESGEDVNSKALEALGKWRESKREESGLSAYMILNQKTMAGIAAIIPRTKEELLGVSGFGNAKWEKFGEEILRLLSPFGKTTGDY